MLDSDSIVLEKHNFVHEKSLKSPWISFLKKCGNHVNWTLRNKVQWNLNRNSYIFIQENPFENGVWKMASILSRPQCVNQLIAAWWWHQASWQTLGHVMAWCLLGAKPLPGLLLTHGKLDPYCSRNKSHWNLNQSTKVSFQRKSI